MLDKIKSEKSPLYFVPNRILCSCGQYVMLSTGEGTSLNIIAMCTNPYCSQHNLDKKIDLTKFAFTEYELL